jgi:hypothetical protein
VKKQTAKNLMLALMAIYPVFLKADKQEIAELFDTDNGVDGVGICYAVSEVMGVQLQMTEPLAEVFCRLYGEGSNPFYQFGHSYYSRHIDHKFRAEKIIEMIAYLETTYKL